MTVQAVVSAPRVRGGAAGVVLRRSAGVYALPLVLGLEVVNALSRDRAWAIEFSGTINWSGSALILAGPVIAGAAAAESVILRRHGGAELLGARHVRRLKVHAARVAATAAWCTLGHVLGVGLCLAFYLNQHAWTFAQAPDPTLVPVLPSLALIWAATALGSLIGWAWPRALTPPLVAAGFYALWLLLVLKLGRTLALTSGTAATPIGFRYRPSLVAGQMLWFSSLAFGAVLLHPRRAGWPRVVVPAANALLVIGSAIAVKSLGPDVSEPDPGARVTWTCRGNAPQVCVGTEYGSQLASLDAAVRPVVAALTRLEVPAPARVEQRQADPRYQTPAAMSIGCR